MLAIDPQLRVRWASIEAHYPSQLPRYLRIIEKRTPLYPPRLRHASYPTTHYTVFDLPPCATSQDIAVRFKELAAQWHPDNSTTGGDEELYKLLTVSYRILKDPEERSRYDRQLTILGNQCETCEGKGLYFPNIKSFRKADIASTTRVECPSCEGTGMRPLKKTKKNGAKRNVDQT